MNRKLLFQTARLPIVKIKIRDGRFQVLGNNRWYSYWRDPYHLMLTIPWAGFGLLTVLSYLCTNALFALLYLVDPNGLANAQPGSFWDAFFFSVQTLATIGYGAMHPQSFYANWIVAIEAFSGLIGVAMFTALAFARFSRPTARVIFSRVAVVAPSEGVPTLMFRAANKRRNQILEAQMRVYLLRDEITAEGHSMRRFHDLPLLHSQTPSFTLSWTAMHAIDETSPLYRATIESLRQSRATIAVSLNGLDETVSQTMYARHNYAPQDILWNSRLVDIFHVTPEGHRYIDYRDFHKATAIDPPLPLPEEEQSKN